MVRPGFGAGIFFPDPVFKLDRKSVFLYMKMVFIL
jgi:hypothetical protein